MCLIKLHLNVSDLFCELFVDVRNANISHLRGIFTAKQYNYHYTLFMTYQCKVFGQVSLNILFKKEDSTLSPVATRQSTTK